MAFPFEIKDVDEEKTKEILKLFTGFKSGFVRVGPSGYFYPSEGYREVGPLIYNMEVLSDDLFVVTSPRSGTTWTQAIVWLIANDLDFKTAEEIHLFKRYTFLDIPIFVDAETRKKMLEGSETNRNFSLKLTYRSRRFLKSHLPLSLLPPNLLDTAKVVYVMRDPRDVAASFYRHNKLIKTFSYVGDFKTYWKLFLEDSISYLPYFAHVKEAWALRHHPNMLLLYYEDLCKDLEGCLHRIAGFLDKQLTDNQVSKLVDYLKFDNFKNNKSCNADFDKLGLGNAGGPPFMYKGQVGSWREYFDEEMSREAEAWIADNLKDSDLRI